MSESSEQNKTEEATPFKLKRAREKGQVARGIDLGYFAALSAFALALGVAAPKATEEFARASARVLAGTGAGGDSTAAIKHAVELLTPTLAPVLALAAIVAAVVILLELVQVRGLFFSAAALKPDFSRLNPAKGLKRVFSMRMLKETLKSIAKLLVYAGVAAWIIWSAYQKHALAGADARSMVSMLWHEGGRLVFAFVLVSLLFALLDQVLARGEFAKQMRMSRRELLREHKDREGEPRLKQKRRQLHAEFARQTKGFSELGGADLVIVNPEHFAVALRYQASTMSAPRVIAKGRNRFALALKQRAFELSLPVFHQPALARALFRACDSGQEAPPKYYRDLASLYLKLKNRDLPEPANVDV